MAGIAELNAEGFARNDVAAVRVNIVHPDDAGHGPFCRLRVDTTAPRSPGVYAWAVDGAVMYVGKAKELVQVVRGASMGRAYNDYTYMPASKVTQVGSPRVRVNGLLNMAVIGGQEVAWWWCAVDTEAGALAVEAELIHRWDPPWNRAHPAR